MGRGLETLAFLLPAPELAGGPAGSPWRCLPRAFVYWMLSANESHLNGKGTFSMKFSRSIMLWGLVLSLSGIFGAMPPILAQDQELTTAKDVVEAAPEDTKDTLKKFVESARDHFLTLPVAALLNLGDTLREEGGDWNYKSMYLVVLTADGTAFYHGEDPSKDGEPLIDEVDDNGKMVVQEIVTALIANDEEEVFVEYSWDDPATDDMNPRYCYAIKGGHPALAGQVFILLGGYHNMVSSTEDETGDLPDFPEISASDVRDRETLKAFVQAAGAWAIEALPTLGFDLTKLDALYKLEGGHWKSGSTYIFTMTPDGRVIFHGAREDQEDTINIDLEDRNGFRFVEALIGAAIDEEASGYVEYYWDDPGVDGDEALGSAKVGYAEAVTLPDDFAIFPGATVIVGSGFYKGNQLALDFAHFANGGGITSDVVVVNASANAVQPDIYFYDTMGGLIDAGSVVDVMGQGLEVTSYGALTVANAIPSLGEATIPTHGMGDLMTGSVKVVSDSTDSPIGGVLRFDLTGVGVAGVGSSQSVRDAIFPARRTAGGINTGAAFRNLSESEQTLTCRLMKDGEALGDDAMVELPANGQDAKFINELFDHDTSDFTGSVRCMSPEGEQEFTAVALELDVNNGIFTTLPVVPVAMDASGSGNGNQVTLYFAHFANGGGITSDIVVVNAAATAAQPDIYFYNTMGEIIDAGSVLDVMGQGLEVTDSGALTVPNPIPPLGEVTIPTHGMGDLMTGSVKVASDSSIGGVLRFDLTGVGVAGVGSSQPVQDAVFPARRVAGGINTGAAFRNLSDSGQMLTCSLMKDGQQLGDDATVDLPANGQDAKFIHEMFDYDTSDFTGSVRCTSPAGGQEFTAVALELDANNRVFTTLPVVPVAQ